MAQPLLILASNSPRRRQLIALGGWSFRVAPADIDETPFSGEEPRRYVARLALSKAQSAMRAVSTADLVVAADTTVADGVEILGKPVNEPDAWRMLRQLRGRVHQVYTAVAVLRPHDGMELVDVCETDVPMRDYIDEEIAAYIASRDPFDKAGAYAIQNHDFHPVTELAGCYANVMGLPLCHLTRLLRQAGIYPAGPIPPACQAALDYSCPVFGQILGEIDARSSPSLEKS